MQDIYKSQAGATDKPASAGRQQLQETFELFIHTRYSHDRITFFI